MLKKPTIFAKKISRGAPHRAPLIPPTQPKPSAAAKAAAKGFQAAQAASRLLMAAASPTKDGEEGWGYGKVLISPMYMEKFFDFYMEKFWLYIEVWHYL